MFTGALSTLYVFMACKRYNTDSVHVSLVGSDASSSAVSVCSVNIHCFQHAKLLLNIACGGPSQALSTQLQELVALNTAKQATHSMEEILTERNYSWILHEILYRNF